jgi:hypothetical protein
MNDNAA